jgi:toxin ParE1/3/4
MAEFKLTLRARRDLEGIAIYTAHNFGEAQSFRYRDELLSAFNLLAEFPFLGRDFGHVKRGLRRHEHASHTIFYRPTKDGVLIQRILGANQDPVRHL